jgi:pimeloyl-ACP methyl ester carboxylesterase
VCKIHFLIPLFVLVLAVFGCQAEPQVTPETIITAEPSPASTNTPTPSPAATDTLGPSATETATPAVLPTKTPFPETLRFEPAECQFSPSSISNVSCGYLVVPENRDQEDGSTIRLHVAIARSYASDPEADPLIYLSGGPGSHALEWLYWNMRNYSDILKKRDVIFFDPRGVGYSEPSLDCPEVMVAFHETLDQAHTSEEWIDQIVSANLVCRDRLLSEGIDLSAYNSAEMAADVNDLRQALGYDMVNLFGVSYGTRTALTVMRDFPAIVRSVALDSPVPLEADILGAEAASAERSRNLVFERCAADEFCNAAFPDLQTSMNELVEKLDADPITIPVTHLGTGETYDVWVDGGILGASVFENLYNYETTIYLPKLIYDSLESEDARYKTLATSLEIYLFYGDYSSEGLRNSVLCSDEGSFTTLEDALEKSESAHPAIAEYVSKEVEIAYRICDVWGAKVAGPIENQPVISDIPALVLSGEYDPVTPPSWGRQVAETLANANYVEFPALGHYVFAERTCPRDIIADFLDNPTTVPDSNCTNFITFGFVTN